MSSEQIKRPATASADSRKPDKISMAINTKQCKFSKLGNETPMKKPQMHYQPRQHSQNPKPKIESCLSSTPKPIKQNLALNSSAHKNTNPAIKKASVLYGNIIKAKYEKTKNLIHESGTSKPSIMTPNFGVQKIHHTPSVSKPSNSIDKTNPLDKLRSELNINSPKKPQILLEKPVSKDNKQRASPINLLSGHQHNRIIQASRKQPPSEKLNQITGEKTLKPAQKIVKPTLLKPNCKLNPITSSPIESLSNCLGLKKEMKPKKTSVGNIQPFHIKDSK